MKFPQIEDKWKILLICILLVVAVVSVYSKIGTYEFINFDDTMYVSHNQHVQEGLSLDNIKWAFSLSQDKDRVYWHPLTWLSHMLDCQLFGINAGRMHLSSLLFHIINVLLLFFVLYFMTGALWESAIVAALFALHPLNVESVVWISERKNLLSTFFWLLTMLAYTHYARQTSTSRYLAVLTAMALGLLAKPMLVTLPFVLLLMDFWPLGRFGFNKQENADPGRFIQSSATHLILEKIPLLFLSFISIGLSVISLRKGNQIISHNIAPMALRLENGIVSYVKYITKIIYPDHLAVFYPFPLNVPAWQIIGAVIILAALSFIFLVSVKKAPYLLIGWLWFLGTLVPVIGIVQGGHWPAIADRWTYVPAIGLFMGFSWGMSDIFRNRGCPRAIKTTLALMVILIYALISKKQVGYWKNSSTLFEHTLQVTSGNYVIHTDLGETLGKEGRINKAVDQYMRALKINPDYVDAHYNLGNALINQGKTTEAIQQFSAALSINPGFEKAHNNLGSAFLSQGRIDDAIYQYLQALKTKPGYIDAQYNLGIALVNKGDVKGAVSHFRKALQLSPHNVNIQHTLEKVLLMQKKSPIRPE